MKIENYAMLHWTWQVVEEVMENWTAYSESEKQQLFQKLYTNLGEILLSERDNKQRTIEQSEN